MKKTLLFAISIASALFLYSCSGEQKTEVAEVDAVEETMEKPEPEIEVIKLEETPGVFTTTELKLQAGKPYTFEVSNKGIDKEVAFVLAPAPANADASVDEIMKTAIPDAMLASMINKDQTASSKAPVTLEAGEYIYFCPLNGTPQYKVTVE